jgi:uncharacterized membrane protein YcaP (DUF421 family)
MMRRNMKRELITEEELMSQLRQQGVGDLSEVEQACVEGDGHISVIKRESNEAGSKKTKMPGH